MSSVLLVKTMIWDWKEFGELSANEIYQILALRQRVFVVEQECAFLDADGLDLKGWHLMGWQKPGDGLCAYVRVLPAGTRFEEISIGRVVTAPEVRGLGIGKDLMLQALFRIKKRFGDVPLRISAQSRLEKFYKEFKFTQVGTPYLEDHIPHIEMIRPLDF